MVLIHRFFWRQQVFDGKFQNDVTWRYDVGSFPNFAKMFLFTISYICPSFTSIQCTKVMAIGLKMSYERETTKYDNFANISGIKVSFIYAKLLFLKWAFPLGGKILYPFWLYTFLILSQIYQLVSYKRIVHTH